MKRNKRYFLMQAIDRATRREVRIPMPGDAVSKVVVLPAGVTAAQWVEITERMNGFAWQWAETTFKPKTDPKLAMGNNVIPISSEKPYEESIINYHERVFVYEVLGKIFYPINDRFVSTELSSSWGNCLICIKKHDGSEVKIDLLALYNVKFIITGQDICANPQLLIDKLNELLPVVDETQPVERVLPEQPSFTPEIDAKDIIADSETVNVRTYMFPAITPENMKAYWDKAMYMPKDEWVNEVSALKDKMDQMLTSIELKRILPAHQQVMERAIYCNEAIRKEMEPYKWSKIYYSDVMIYPVDYKFIGSLEMEVNAVYLYVRKDTELV